MDKAEILADRIAEGHANVMTSHTKSGKKTCNFYVQDKKRNCRMPTKEGEAMCVVHFDDPKRRRVQCPLDPTHTVFTYTLKKHLKRCNAKKKESLNLRPFYARNLNNGGTVILPVPVELSLRDLDDVQLLQLVEKINTISSLYLPEATLEIGNGSCKGLQEEIDCTWNGNEAKRHLRQTSSILHLLEKLNCLNPNTCFIEFGSGKGGLTYWISQALVELPKPETQSFVLVDRSSPRHKRDNKLLGTAFKVDRIRIDIQDLKLDQVKLVGECANLVGMSKHLCGNATDMALTCLLDTNSMVSKVSGFVFATCCHQQCTWNNFVGKSSFLKWGFNVSDFKPLTGITSWYVCGTGTAKYANSSENFSSLKYARLGLDFESRRLLGCKAKRLLDFARCEFVKSKGFDNVRFSTFVLSDDTFENVCIVGGR